MHPYISQVLAAERARDLRNEASAARLARQARLARKAQRARLSASAAVRASAGSRSARSAASAPNSYADFLRLTARPLLREPSAAERARGLTVG
jgi:hypothetical protein